jgi:hypothetical protein
VGLTGSLVRDMLSIIKNQAQVIACLEEKEA